MAEPFYKDLKGILSDDKYMFYISADGVGIHHKPAAGLHVSEEELPLAFVELANTTCGLVMPDGLRLGTTTGVMNLPFPINPLIEDQTPYIVEVILENPTHDSVTCMSYSAEDDWFAVGYETGFTTWQAGSREAYTNVTGGLKDIAITPSRLVFLTAVGVVKVYNIVGTSFTLQPTISTPKASAADFSNKYFLDLILEDDRADGGMNEFSNYTARFGNYTVFGNDAAALNMFREEADGQLTHLPQQAFVDAYVPSGTRTRQIAWSGDGQYLACAQITAAPFYQLFKRVGEVMTNITVEVGLETATYGCLWIGQVLILTCGTVPYFRSYTLAGDVLSESGSGVGDEGGVVYPIAVNAANYIVGARYGRTNMCHWTGSALVLDNSITTAGYAYDCIAYGDYFITPADLIHVSKVVGGVLVAQYTYNLSQRGNQMLEHKGYLLVCSDRYNQINVFTVGVSALTKHSTFTVNYLITQSFTFQDDYAGLIRTIGDYANGDFGVTFYYTPGYVRLRMDGTAISNYYSKQVTSDLIQVTNIAWSGIYAAVARSNIFSLHKQGGGVNLEELEDLGTTSAGGTVSSMHWYGDYLAVAITSAPYLKLYKRTGDVLSTPLTIPAMPGSAIFVRWSLNNLLFYRSGQSQIYVFTLTGDVLTAGTTLVIPAALSDIDTISNLVGIGHTVSPYVTFFMFTDGVYTNTDPSYVGESVSSVVAFQSTGLFFTGQKSSTNMRHYNLRGGVVQLLGICGNSSAYINTLTRCGSTVIIGEASLISPQGGDSNIGILIPSTGSWAWTTSRSIKLAAYRVDVLECNDTHMIFAMGTASWGHGPVYARVFSAEYLSAIYAMALEEELMFDQGPNLVGYDLDSQELRTIANAGEDINTIELTENAGGTFGVAMVGTNSNIKFIRMSEV